MKSKLLASILFTCAAIAATSSSAADLTVRLVGLEEGEGQARAALFASLDAYESGQRLAGVSAEVVGDSVVLVFSDVAPGTYGVSAFQDMNGNEEIDKNFLGIPKERFGFSNDARASFGPPDFDAISFEVGNESLQMEINLRR